jgi:hypothetical protein
MGNLVYYVQDFWGRTFPKTVSFENRDHLCALAERKGKQIDDLLAQWSG